jgi:6-phosphogluconate dehydrogenase
MEQRIGMVGLGRMGGNMARRMARAGLRVAAWDRAAGARAGIAAEERVQVAETLPALVAALPAPRVLWLMLPAGAPTEETIGELRSLLAAGDVIVDGANAWYRTACGVLRNWGRSACTWWTPGCRAASGGW